MSGGSVGVLVRSVTRPGAEGKGTGNNYGSPGGVAFPVAIGPGPTARRSNRLRRRRRAVPSGHDPMVATTNAAKSA